MLQIHTSRIEAPKSPAVQSWSVVELSFLLTVAILEYALEISMHQ